MTQQFTASEVRESAIAVVARDMEYEAEMLRAYADLLEAQERAVPVAYALFTEKGLLRMWAREWFADVHGAPVNLTPLYTHPAPSDAERLAEALRVIRQHVAKDPSALAVSIIATCDEALAAHSAQAQPPANTERLAELLRGLEIGPMAAMLSPKELFAIGAAIAAQAKEAQPPAASLTFATPKTEEDVMAYLRIAKLHIKRFREILQAALAAQENPNG